MYTRILRPKSTHALSDLLRNSQAVVHRKIQDDPQLLPRGGTVHASQSDDGQSWKRNVQNFITWYPLSSYSASHDN